MDLRKLHAEFPREAVHWRVQGTPYKGRGGFAAMALAYIDARDVMDRLDDVCSPENWQTEYTETPSGRVICRIGINTAEGWVWKGDGAGSTQVEGEKGGISDALKRAAVAWGIGRYLYRLDAPWVACEVNEKGGKVYWKRWTEDPWSKVKNVGYTPPPPLPNDIEPNLPDFVANCRDQHVGGEGFAEYVADTFNAGWKRCKTPKQMSNALDKHRPSLDWLEAQDAEQYARVIDGYETHLMELTGNFERAAE